MEFQERLQKAIQRGRRRGDDRAHADRQRQLNAEELKSLHTKHRLHLSEQIEKCLAQLPQHFPGFQFETSFGEKGWGGACSRDDIGRGGGGRRANYFSRIEVVIRPFSDLHVLDLAAKGTVRNKEVFNRNHFEKLTEADPDNFSELIDLWVLEFAEIYAAAE